MHRHVYYRLVSASKRKIDNLYKMMFNKSPKIIKTSKLYYAETFFKIKNQTYQLANIPRHLLYNDTFLIVISKSNYRLCSTFVYTNGEIRKSYNVYDDFFRENKVHCSLYESNYKRLKQILSAEAELALDNIKNSYLFISILQKFHFFNAYPHNYEEAETFEKTLNKNYKLFALNKKLDYETFRDLFS